MFLYCECGWSQDDFWEEGVYSPLENSFIDALKKELLQGRIYLPYKESYSMLGDITIHKDEKGKFYVDSREYVAANLEKIAKKIRKMAIPTKKEWEKSKDTFKCPKCGRNDKLGVD